MKVIIVDNVDNYVISYYINENQCGHVDKIVEILKRYGCRKDKNTVEWAFNPFDSYYLNLEYLYIQFFKLFLKIQPFF